MRGELVEGGMYRVRYRTQSQKVDRILVAKFIFFSKDLGGQQIAHLSGRPKFGDTAIPVKEIIEVELVKSTMEPDWPRKVSTGKYG